MTAPRSYRASAWYRIAGRTYTSTVDGNVLCRESQDPLAVIDWWRRMVDDPHTAGIPRDAEVAWVSDIVVWEEAADGRWFVHDRSEPPKAGRCLLDRREPVAPQEDAA